jgi:chromosome segregation ATPase
LQGSRAVEDGLNGRLTSLAATRDELLQEITQLQIDAQKKDAEMSAAGKELLAEHTGVLAGKNFEVSELKNQITRTETYADKLRRQLQDRKRDAANSARTWRGARDCRRSRVAQPATDI